MKKKFLDFSLKIIKASYPDYDETKMEEVRYGLEGMYLTYTKLIVIVLIALLLDIFKEMITLLIFFNILRTTGFGLHATKSWICLLSSSLIFVGLPFIAKIITIPIYIKVILGIVAIILTYKYAPADTKKRPLINAKKRKRYKYITTINVTILALMAIFIKNNTLTNLIIFGIYTEIVMILPITYKIFKLSYNNYKNYKLNLN